MKHEASVDSIAQPKAAQFSISMLCILSIGTVRQVVENIDSLVNPIYSLFFLYTWAGF